MKLYRLRTLNEYKKHAARNGQRHVYIREYESRLAQRAEREFTVPGISYPANEFVDFLVDYKYSDGENINWRERLVCPITQLNNRLRSCMHLLDIEVSPYTDSNMYITEQVTPLYAKLKEKHPNLAGSEFLGNLKGGTIENGIRHEDMTNLSFGDHSFESYLTFECLEHIPDYKKAIIEAYRVLKPGGTFLGTFPFDTNRYANFIRATLNEKNEIVHWTEPQYHGDPVNEQGILCFTVFGWEVLQQFRSAGFRDVYVILLWSDVFGYLGGEQLFLVAHK